MSYCRKEGKDQIIFVTEEDHNTPSKVPFPEEDEEDKPAIPMVLGFNGDKIAFSKECHDTLFPQRDCLVIYSLAGLVLPNGEINWGCPCLGGMATGPCGVEFREAFTCFHFSKAETKGSDCLEPFRAMSECMSHYPGVYGSKEEEEDLMKEDLMKEDLMKEDLMKEDLLKEAEREAPPAQGSGSSPNKSSSSQVMKAS